MYMLVVVVCVISIRLYTGRLVALGETVDFLYRDVARRYSNPTFFNCCTLLFLPRHYFSTHAIERFTGMGVIDFIAL